jgi:site-specific DNA-methyltransferase (adenine-specific)
MNNILCGDAADLLHTAIDQESIDLTVTSPPYDDARTYDGYRFDLERIITGLLRVTKQGGVVVWVVGDTVKSKGESLTSFRHAITFAKFGFTLHDTMIYAKANPVPNDWMKQKRFRQAFEYMFVFSKGTPKTFNALARPKSNKWNDSRTFRTKKFTRNKQGEFKALGVHSFQDHVMMENIWTYSLGGGNTSEEWGIDHPAMFPEQLALDHILAWSNKGDTVLDPMCGSGTTLKMAKLTGRNYIGIDSSQKYCDIAEHRVGSVSHDALEFTTVPFTKDQKYAILI